MITVLNASSPQTVPAPVKQPDTAPVPLKPSEPAPITQPVPQPQTEPGRSPQPATPFLPNTCPSRNNFGPALAQFKNC